MEIKETITEDYKLLKNNNDFENERELLEYIVDNIKQFSKDILKAEYKSHIVELCIKPLDYYFDNTISIDLAIEDTKGMYHLLELKVPKNAFGENLRGIGQCLSYRFAANVYNLNVADVYLITTKHSNIVSHVIRENNLNIKYVYFDKTKHAIQK